MRRGKPSRTAQFVAYNRALGNPAPVVRTFSDSIADLFLTRDWARKVEVTRAKLLDSKHQSPYPFWLRGMGTFNQFRTVVLDRAIELALPFEQMVILVAGLDSRAWRLVGLRNTVVFEVDHPDTQGLKRGYAAKISRCAREVRFVDMDFSRDDLGFPLAKRGA